MPKRLDARKTALLAWCGERPDDPTARDVLQTLTFAQYAREAWDTKCRSRTYAELWAQAAGTLAPAPAPERPQPQPGLNRMPARLEAREEALRAWCERNAANPMAPTEAILAELGDLPFGMDHEAYGAALRELWDRVAQFEVGPTAPRQE